MKQFVPGVAGRVIGRAATKIVGKRVNQFVARKVGYSYSRYSRSTRQYYNDGGYSYKGMRKFGRDFRTVARYSLTRRAVHTPGRYVGRTVGGVSGYIIGTRM